MTEDRPEQDLNEEILPPPGYYDNLDPEKKSEEPPSDSSEESRHFDEVPEVENLSQEDTPDPSKDTVNDEALQANSRYWSVQDLAYAGRLEKTTEFLPGRTVRLHTPDIGELIWIGKRLDLEFGKIDPRVGISSSYDEGIKLITLAVVVNDIDGEPVYSPTSDIENPLNPNLSAIDREVAIERKHNAIRRKWQTWYPFVIGCIFDVYRELLIEQEEAQKLLPFYSAAGERLPDSDL